MKGYEAFVVELKEDLEVCVNRNIHQRTRQEIEEVGFFVQPDISLTPLHLITFGVHVRLCCFGSKQDIDCLQYTTTFMCGDIVVF